MFHNKLKWFVICIDMGVSKNSGTPKWMVQNNGQLYEQMDDLGG